MEEFLNKFRTLFHIKKYLVKYNINNNVGFSNSFIELIQKDPIKTADFWIKTIPLISEVQKTIEGELDTLKLQRKNLQQSFDGIYSNYKSLVSKKKEIDADLKDLLNKKQGLTSVGANLQNNITSLESDLNKVELNLLTSVQLEKNKKLEQATFIQIEKTKNLITLSPDSIELSTIRAKLNDLNIKLKETRDIIDNHIKNVQLKESYTLSLERSKKKLETNKQNIKNYNFEIDKQIKLVNEHNDKLKVLRESYESKDKEIVQLADKIKEVKKTKIYFNLQSINENIKELNFDILKNIDIEKLKLDINIFKKGILNIFNENTTGFEMNVENDKNIYNYTKFHSFLNDLKLFDNPNSGLNGILNGLLTESNCIKFKNFEFFNTFINIYIKDFNRFFESLVNLEKQFLTSTNVAEGTVYLKEIKTFKFKLSLLLFNIMYHNLSEDSFSFYSKGLAPKGLMSIKSVTDYDIVTKNIFIKIKETSEIRLREECKLKSINPDKLKLFTEFFKIHVNPIDNKDKSKSPSNHDLKKMVTVKSERMKQIDDKMKAKETITK